MSVTLTDKDLPPLFREADVLSGKEQDRFFRWTGASLALIVLTAFLSVLAGAVNAEVGGVDMIAALAGIVFFFLAFMSFYLDRERPDGRWYQARAVAESVRTLAWQYAAGGGDLMRDGPGDPDAIFRSHLTPIMRRLPEGELHAALDEEQITPGMREIRAASLADRYEAYCTGRIEDQLKWYMKRSQEKSRQARITFGVVTAVQLLGVALAGIAAFGGVDIDVLGIPAAMGAGFIAWLQAKDYTVVARSYGDT